jgi:anaerobic ribonucleoside-triphosphate reductase activating protein
LIKRLYLFIEGGGTMDFKTYDLSSKNVFSVCSAMYPSMNSNISEVSLDIFFVGCNHKCKGCHNIELWKAIPPNKTWLQLVKTVDLATEATVVTLMGGEPLQQDLEWLSNCIAYIKSVGKKVCLYTGGEFEDVPDFIKDNLDYVKTGKYDEDNLTPIGSFLASKNQRMYRKRDNTWEIQWEYTETNPIKSL